MATASNLVSLFLRRLAAVKNSHVAEITGIDETFLSRFTHGERGLRIEQIEPFLSALGLAVIECKGETITVSREEWDAMRLFAKKGIEK